MEKHGHPNPGKGHMRLHEIGEVVELIAEEEQPEGGIEPKDPV